MDLDASTIGLIAIALPLVLAVVVVAVLAWASRTYFSGTLPMLHLFIPRGYKEEDIPDLSGKYCLITGANSGLGFGTAKVLARHGANVIMIARSIKECDAAAKEVEKEANKAEGNKAKGKQIIKTMHLDLASLESVEAFIKEYKETGMPIHHLYLNAGVMIPPYGLTKDGIETQFGTNHVGHQALLMGLLDVIKKTSQDSTVSIIAVSSTGHFLTHSEGIHLSLDKINDEKIYDKAAWYGQSKLANVLMAKKISRTLAEEGFKNIRVQAVHPGGVRGKLNRHIVIEPITEKINDTIQAMLYWDIDTAALTSIGAALRSDVPNGTYFVPVCRPMEPSKFASDPGFADKVWALTQEIIKSKRPSLAA